MAEDNLKDTYSQSDILNALGSHMRPVTPPPPVDKPIKHMKVRAPTAVADVDADADSYAMVDADFGFTYRLDVSLASFYTS